MSEPRQSDEPSESRSSGPTRRSWFVPRFGWVGLAGLVGLGTLALGWWAFAGSDDSDHRPTAAPSPPPVEPRSDTAVLSPVLPEIVRLQDGSWLPPIPPALDIDVSALPEPVADDRSDDLGQAGVPVSDDPPPQQPAPTDPPSAGATTDASSSPTTAPPSGPAPEPAPEEASMPPTPPPAANPDDDEVGIGIIDGDEFGVGAPPLPPVEAPVVADTPDGDG